MELAPELIARLEARRHRRGAAAGVRLAAAPVGEAALVGAEALQSFVAPGEIAFCLRRDAVLGAGAAMIAQTLERPSARAVLQADGIPVRVQAFAAVEARAARNDRGDESCGQAEHARL